MRTSASHRVDLALPIGISLIGSTAALLLLPGLVTVACQFFIGLVLVGIFATRTLLRYARERRASHMKEPSASRRTVDRGDVLLLIGFAALYAAISGSLMRAGWSAEAVRSGALLLLLSFLLLKPRIAALLNTPITGRVPLDTSRAVGLSTAQSVASPEVVNQERIQ